MSEVWRSEMRRRVLQAAMLLLLSMMLSSCANTVLPAEDSFYAASGCEADACDKEPWQPGYATRANIANLAENIADLYLPRKHTPRDAMRRDAVFSDYFHSRAKATASAASASVQSNQTAVKP